MKAIILTFLLAIISVNSQAPTWVGDYYVLYPCDPTACCCPSLNTKVSIATSASNIVLSGTFPSNAVCKNILVKPDNGTIQFPWSSTNTAGSDVADPDTDFQYTYSLQVASSANPFNIGAVSLSQGSVGSISSVQTSQQGSGNCTFVLMQAPNKGSILSVFSAVVAFVVMIVVLV